MSGFPDFPPAYNNASIGWKLLTTDYVSISIAFVLVVGRLYTKFFLTRCPGWEDACSVVALLLAIARVVGDSLGVNRYYLGRHFSSVPKSDFSAIQGVIVADGLLYVVAITFAKLAILIFLYRIFKIVPKFRYTAWTIGAIMTVWALISVLLVIFSCKPVAAAFSYAVRILPTTVCRISAAEVEIVFGFCNIFVDIMLLFMPMPLLWSLHMTQAKKIGVSIIFANGAVICATAIVRQYILYHPGGGEDASWSIITIKIWMVLEVNLAIICGCLPVLQPLFRLVPFLPSHIRSKFSGGRSGAEQASWPKRLTGPGHYGSHDVERGTPVRKAPWREPDELSDSSESPLSMYHQQPGGAVVRSALEPDSMKMERLRTDEALKGVAV